MNWRTSGDTTIEAFRATLPAHSEIVKRGEVEAVYYSAQPYTRLVLGMLKAESSYATHFNAVPASMKNPLNLRKRGQEPFQTFSSIAACVDEWRERITSPNYAYKDTQTVRELVEIYAPSFENDVNKYVATVEAVIRSLPVIREEVSAVSVPFPAPPLQISILPWGKNRPGHVMASPSWITVHEVGNQGPGADEEMHRIFVHNGGGEWDVSFHFVVGPTKAVQLMPLDEVAWHASDGSGPGNFDSIAIETIQIGDFNRTLWHLAWLINEIATNPTRFFSNKPRQWDMSIEKIKQHHDWAPDGKNCPEFIRNRGLWPELMRRVDLYNAASQPEPEPQPDPEPAPKHEIPAGQTFEGLRRRYGRFIHPTTGAEERFDLNTAPSQVWLANGKKTGLWPKAEEIIRRGNGNEIYRWGGGFEWEREKGE